MRCKTGTRQDRDTTTDMTETKVDTTKEREEKREPSSGQPTILVETPEMQKNRGENEHKGKTHAKQTNMQHKKDRQKTLEREEMNWTGLDWTGRTETDGPTQRSLHSTRL